MAVIRRLCGCLSPKQGKSGSLDGASGTTDTSGLSSRSTKSSDGSQLSLLLDRQQQHLSGAKSSGPVRLEDACAKLEVSDLSVGVKLGEGHFGAVYRGTWRGETVALKFALPEQVDALRKECKMLVAVRHPNIMAVYGSCDPPSGDGGAAAASAAGWPEGILPPVMVCEFLDGGPFLDFLRRTKGEQGAPAHWSTVCRLLREAGEGLAYLHSRNIMHRDIKSLNVVLHRVGEEQRVKLVDFGLARFAQRCAAAATLKVREEPAVVHQVTTMGMHRVHTIGIGTYTHMAPEVMSSSEYTVAADVFSFGILTSEALAGDDADEIVDETRTGDFGLNPGGLRKMLAPDAPPLCGKLVDIAVECCRMHRDARPSMDSVIQRLGELHQAFGAASHGSSPMSHGMEVAVTRSGGKEICL